MPENLKPIGNVIYRGLDVSEFQGEIDWEKVYTDGKRLYRQQV